MDRGIIGGIIGFLLGSLVSKEETFSLDVNSDYVLPFKGHWINRGNWDNEDWYYYEYKYRTRYVNVVENDDHYVISID